MIKVDRGYLIQCTGSRFVIFWWRPIGYLVPQISSGVYPAAH